MSAKVQDKHLVYHHNMFGPSCEVANANCDDDFMIYCHKEHKICIPTQCNMCSHFGGDEMGCGKCCVWEDADEEIIGDEHVVQHDEAYFEFQRVENPALYKSMKQMIEAGEIDLCKLWQNIDWDTQKICTIKSHSARQSNHKD